MVQTCTACGQQADNRPRQQAGGRRGRQTPAVRELPRAGFAVTWNKSEDITLLGGAVVKSRVEHKTRVTGKD